MEIGDKKETLILISILQFNKIFERAQIVAQMQTTRGLNAGN